MSGSTSRTWRNLLEEKHAAFRDHGYQLSPAITSESSFRSHFEELCKRVYERRYTRLLFKLQYGTIEAFASAVDATLDHEPLLSLGALVAGGAFAVIQCACNARIELWKVVEALGQLNSTLPPLGADITRFPHDQTVQNPLQDIFRAYMDALLGMVVSFSHCPIDADPMPIFKMYLDESATKFEMGRTTFVRMLEVAIRGPAREPSMSLSNFSESFLNTQKNPYDTQARFIPKRKLGWGSFGRVDEVEEVSTREVYARKQISLPTYSSSGTGHEVEIRNEVRTMQKLTHQHIVTVLFWLKEQDCCSIFMKPAADYDLRFFLEGCIQNGYPESDVEKVLPWFGCLLDALAFAHKQKIMHRDIKPSNILIKDDQVFLADFGLAKDFTFKETSQTNNISLCGTPVYRAPEVSPECPRGRAADIFSLGCVFSEMLTVYDGLSLDAYQEYREAPENDSGVFAFRANLPRVEEWLSKLRRVNPSNLQDFLVFQISSMLAQDPDHRPSAPDAMRSFLAYKRHDILFCDLHR
ncbi:putative Protein kinase domain-containing protein [Seiridium unicorne]|uniref:Protein kinase domain-containing protein n=1 Tax=Seiridium unicorne TaxID=138068 RepID=A0ABR2V8J4_9PEZI